MNGAKVKWGYTATGEGRGEMGALKHNENQALNNLKKEINQTEGGDENIPLRSLLRMQTFIKWKKYAFFKYFSVLRELLAEQLLHQWFTFQLVYQG